MSHSASSSALPVDIFALVTKAARALHFRILRSRIRGSTMACQVLIRQIENDLLCMNQYPEFTNALYDQIEAAREALHLEMAKLAVMDQKLAQGTA